ncbi:MAG: hypothetical protein RIM72_09030 [Alphaproteobacteria bacterium]
MAEIQAIMAVASTLHGIQQSNRQRRKQAAHAAQQQRHATLRQQIEERRLERERRSAEASARARLGASGAGVGDGSGAAVLRGLNKKFDEQLAEGRSLFNASPQAGSLLSDDDPFGSILEIGQSLVTLGSVIEESEPQEEPGP